MRKRIPEGLNLMNTTMISGSAFEAGWCGPRRAVGDRTSVRLVKAFGDRIYSIAKRITQSDEDAADVLIESFVEVCSDLDDCQDDGRVWLRLVTVAVREAFAKLRNRLEGRPLFYRATDACEELVVRELSYWGDHSPQRHPGQQTARQLEHGLSCLDPMCRTVFMLRDIEDIPVKQIANILNRSVAAVEVCLLRARLQLRETLTRQMRLQT